MGKEIKIGSCNYFETTDENGNKNTHKVDVEFLLNSVFICRFSYYTKKRLTENEMIEIIKDKL